MASEYVFIDEWDVDAPREAVFRALADASTYPDWWKPVYIAVEADGPPEVGRVSHQEFKGQLPYHLKMDSEIAVYQPPDTFTVECHGDLTGRGVWTLTDAPDGRVHVHFDWRVIADRPLLRYLTPVLRPLFRWNHNWSIKRAVEGLEPYARQSTEGDRDVKQL
jgi:uncharacterized protein YndB with AHSA1/START domain